MSAILIYQPRAKTAARKTADEIMLQVLWLVTRFLLQPIVAWFRSRFSVGKQHGVQRWGLYRSFFLFCLQFWCGDAKFFNCDRFPLKLDDAAIKKEKELRQKRVRFFPDQEIRFATSWRNNYNLGLSLLLLQDSIIVIAFSSNKFNHKINDNISAVGLTVMIIHKRKTVF